MKDITFTVPCYNSAAYMRRCIDSLLAYGDLAEIIIVNDGSTDETGRIAAEYEQCYPNIVRAVQKENGGHGSGVNAGLALAVGTYFKVVDSDDWLDKEAIYELQTSIREFEEMQRKVAAEIRPDMIVCNYVYDHLYENRQQSMKYLNVFPEKVVCSWNETGSFRPSQYLIMHALIFRTEVLRRAGVKLPEHTFYVDNIFAYQPLPLVERIYYINVDLYHYFLGRDDQSVNESVLMKRIDQQIKVTRIVAGCVDLGRVKQTYPKLASYMCRNVSIMMAISSIHLLLIGSKEAWAKRDALWNDVKKQNSHLYYRLKYATLSGFTYLPGKPGGKVTVTGYRMARRIYQFN